MSRSPEVGSPEGGSIPARSGESPSSSDQNGTGQQPEIPEVEEGLPAMEVSRLEARSSARISLMEPSVTAPHHPSSINPANESAASRIYIEAPPKNHRNEPVVYSPTVQDILRMWSTLPPEEQRLVYTRLQENLPAVPGYLTAAEASKRLGV